MSSSLSSKVECRECVHFKSAPFQAKRPGCYQPELMKSKQKDSFLDEQQIPGDYEELNRLGDCSYFEAGTARASLWLRLLSG